MMINLFQKYEDAHFESLEVYNITNIQLYRC